MMPTDSLDCRCRSWVPLSSKSYRFALATLVAVCAVAAPLPTLPGALHVTAAGTPIATVGLTAGWATFGEAPPPGAATTGLQIGSLTTQTDIKNRWPDGSIKFAIV